MTALAGLPAFFELAGVLGLVESMEAQVDVRGDSQGWTDAEMLMALVLLNLAGGDHAEDLDRLEADEGSCQVMVRLRGSRLAERGDGYWRGAGARAVYERFRHVLRCTATCVPTTLRPRLTPPPPSRMLHS
ncbi:MAG: hypothetical protein FJ109_22155 [Deltaproteobacteria bacterium]|nr:hypothetical protein [Deltaproteobacteria bacterium]